MEKKFYLCKKCGNVALKVVDSGVTPSCCDQEMVELVAKTTDVASEKHVPVVTRVNDCTVRVVVGSIPHPMSQEHHICFIYLETTCGDQIKWLTTDKPAEATFCCGNDEFVAAYEYCNLHGLWKATNIMNQPTDADTEKKCNSVHGHILNFLFSFLAMSLMLVSCKSSDKSFDNTPVADFKLQQYMGDWYEIARFDHSFEDGISNAKATYTMDDGFVRIKNSGWKKEHFRVSLGRAKQPEPTANPGLLRVSFFRPFYSDYRVLMIGPKYDYALVGSNSKKYLWLLSRTPILNRDNTQTLLHEAQKRGYSIDDLLWIDQRKHSDEKIY